MAGVFYSQFHIHETAFTEIVTSHFALVTSPLIILYSIVHLNPSLQIYPFNMILRKTLQ